MTSVSTHNVAIGMSDLQDGMFTTDWLIISREDVCILTAYCILVATYKDISFTCKPGKLMVTLLTVDIFFFVRVCGWVGVGVCPGGMGRHHYRTSLGHNELTDIVQDSWELTPWYVTLSIWLVDPPQCGPSEQVKSALDGRAAWSWTPIFHLTEIKEENALYQ